MFLSDKVKEFLTLENPKTPCLVVDLDVVEKNYKKFVSIFMMSKVFYAVKANPASPVLRKLVNLGSSFDTASLAEIEKCISAGACPESISYGNTVKKQRDIERAYNLGVRLFAFDSIEELKKLRIAAPGAKVFCRLLTNNEGANWPLLGKFGCSLSMATDLLIMAEEWGLDAYGLSFHVGSQQTKVSCWESTLKRTAPIFMKLKNKGIDLRMLNLGGGFPIRYREDVPELSQLASSIKLSITQNFGEQIPTIFFEPGRCIIGSAGLIRSEVVLVSEKTYEAKKRWIYLDVGVYGGLAETMNEAIQYPLVSSKDQYEKGPVIIAGPSCDGFDVLYRKAPYQLPLALKAGDNVDILCAGAYTASYACADFNGFPPLSEYYL